MFGKGTINRSADLVSGIILTSNAILVEFCTLFG
jgi:hypothetical protein